MAQTAAREYRVKHRRSEPLRLDSHPDTPAEQNWRDWVQGSTAPIAVDLFCGAGGLSCGLEAAGWKVALAADSDEWSLESHRHNVAGRALHLDLGEQQDRDVLVEMLNGVDVGLVAGGPPCQPFSRAGHSKIRSLVQQGVRNGTDSRRGLWRGFLELVEVIQPRAVLMENVPDMALGDGFAVLRKMIERLGKAGYAAEAKIVDAWRFGVPQHRQRLILVGLRGGIAFKWPRETAQTTVRDAIWDLPRLHVAPDIQIGAPEMDHEAIAAGSNGSSSDRWEATGDDTATRSAFVARAREGCTGDNSRIVYDHQTRAVRADDFEAFNLMDGRTLYSDLPDALKRYRDDIFDDKYNRLDWDKLSRTITAHIAKDGYWYIHPEQPRTLTVREAARLQTFPDTFRFAGHRSHQFQQIGNAVPPALGQLIGEAILYSLRVQATPGHPQLLTTARRNSFGESLQRWSDDDSVAKLAVATLARGEGRYGQRWADLLSGPISGMVASAPALRVASRVSGAASEGRPHRSAARMELAQLIGIGEQARKLNIIAHVLGTEVCKPAIPLCDKCPVSNICAESSGAEL